jgi:phosphatidylglycerol lysyltransferase
VAGDPVGPAERIPSLIQSFREFARINGMALCFLAVGPRYLGLYVALGLRALKIGEEALISLPDFDRQTLKRKVRRAARHVADNGIRAVRYRHADLPEHLLRQIIEVDQEWVALKGGEERGFSMTLGRLPRVSDPDCEFMVALEGDHVWGYLVLVPVYQRQSWSLDAMRRRAMSPNGLMEFLVISACEEYRKRGYQELSLNFATLSNSEDNISSRALEGTRSFLFDHLSSFYQLKSLQQFNAKFGPSWRSRYMAYEGILNLPRLAFAVVQAEDPIRLPPLTQLLRRQVSGRSQLTSPEPE